jgi:hypothetical protein
MDGDLRRADLHLERHPRVPFNGDRTQSPCARMPRRSIGLPTISLKEHRRRRLDQSGSAEPNQASRGWLKALPASASICT